jgi:hypothetical protein
MAVSYLSDDLAKLNNPNLQVNLYVQGNLRRNSARTTAATLPGIAQDGKPNNGINLHEWIAFIGKLDSNLSSGTFASDVAVGTTADVAGALYWNSTNSQLQANLTVQGSYADDAAAASGSVEVGQLYWNTTNDSVQARIS